MKIVIDIPEELYKKISLNNPPYGEDFPLYYAVRNCTKLPKGHGKLKDIDALKREIAGHEYSDSFCKEHHIDHSISTAVVLSLIDDATTTVEADKKEGRSE